MGGEPVSRWSRWVATLDRREAATSLALFRIAIGLIVAGHLLTLMWHGTDLYVWVDAAHGGLRSIRPGWLAPWGGATPFNIRAVESVVIVAALLLSAGCFTRPAAFVTWLGFRFLADLNGHSGGSYDELLKSEIFLLMLSGAGNALSFDARFRGKRGLVPAWPRYVLVGQLVLVYWATGMQKVSAGWVPGGSLDALWYILQQPTWQRSSMHWLAPWFPLSQLATAATWWFEQAAPLLLLAAWYRATRTRSGWLRAQFNRIDLRVPYLAAGVAMHAGIEATMEVGPFSVAMLALYVCCFHPDEWKRPVWYRWVRGRWSGPAPTSP